MAIIFVIGKDILRFFTALAIPIVSEVMLFLIFIFSEMIVYYNIRNFRHNFNESIGYLPTAVSPDNIVAVAPSRTEFDISKTSAFVGWDYLSYYLTFQ